MSDSISSNAIADTIFRTTADGILIADEDGHITKLNAAACAMLGITPEEALHHEFHILFGKNPTLLSLFRRKDTMFHDVRLPRRRLAQGIGETMPSGERIVLLQDVTEKREFDDRRDALTRAIAHDLRNPISAIGGFVDLVSKSGETTPIQRKFLTRARQTVNKLNDMLNSLVDLAWIEAGMPLKHVPLRLDETIQKAVDNLSDTARRHGVGIVLSIQQQLPAIMGDPDRVTLAIHHLLNNAIQYTLQPERNIVIHAWSDDHEIYCNVADQGIGISEEDLNLIFDRMYRSKDERILDVPGGGLGLTIARTIIKRHGGEIWATSNAQDGTTLSFVLPISNP